MRRFLDEVKQDCPLKLTKYYPLKSRNCGIYVNA